MCKKILERVNLEGYQVRDVCLCDMPYSKFLTFWRGIACFAHILHDHSCLDHQSRDHLGFWPHYYSFDVVCFNDQPIVVLVKTEFAMV